MKNVTITMDEAVAKQARVRAAEAGKSLSRWVGELVEKEVINPSTRQDQLGTLRQLIYGVGWPGISESLPSRDELHDRPVLRRHKRPDLRDGSERPRKARSRGGSA